MRARVCRGRLVGLVAPPLSTRPQSQKLTSCRIVTGTRSHSSRNRNSHDESDSRDVAETFLSAGSRDFPVPCRRIFWTGDWKVTVTRRLKSLRYQERLD